MTGALQGFAVIGVIIAIGYGVGRLGLVSARAENDLSRLVMFVMIPCLLVTMLLEADIGQLFSSLLVVSLLAAVLTIGCYLLVAGWLWKRDAPETIIGSFAASFANTGNIGIPVSMYVLGSAAYAAPVLVLQAAVFTPLALVALDIATADAARSSRRVIAQAMVNPVLIATVVGVTVAALGIPVPKFVVDPFRLVGEAAVPIMLLPFGMSLSGQRPLAPGTGRRDVILATALKLAFMPVAAWVLGRFVFAMEPKQLLAVTVLAALPTAQNVLAIAQRHQRGEILARDTALVTTLGSIPVLLTVTLLLSGT